MLRIQTLRGKTIRQWAAEDLPQGAFRALAREVDPFWGLFAAAGAVKRKYRVRRHSLLYGREDLSTVNVEAFDKKHACAIAYDEHGWSGNETNATLIREDT